MRTDPAIRSRSTRFVIPVKNSASTPAFSYAWARRTASSTPAILTALVRPIIVRDASSRAASAAHAYTMAQQDEEAMPCHEEEIPNANVCLSHCTQSDQISADQHEVPIAAPASAKAPAMREKSPAWSAV